MNTIRRSISIIAVAFMFLSMFSGISPAGAQEAATPTEKTEFFCVQSDGTLDETHPVTDPADCAKRTRANIVCPDGSLVTDVALCGMQADEPQTPESRSVVNNNVAVDVDVTNQTETPGRVSLDGGCPSISEVQQTTGLMVDKDGANCAFYIRHMSDEVSVPTIRGWGMHMQLDGYPVVAMVGDGRTYDAIAVTYYPTAHNACDLWTGAYQREVYRDDPNGQSYDTYVVLPPDVETCQVHTDVRGDEDALSIGRVINLSEMDQYVTGVYTTVSDQSNTTESTKQESVASPETEDVIQVDETEATPEVVEKEDVPIIAPSGDEASVDALPATGNDGVESSFDCSLDPEAISRLLGVPELVDGSWHPIDSTGVQYTGNQVSFDIPQGKGIAIISTSDNIAQREGAVDASTFSFYCEG
jgi:hypothetical protein